MIVSSTWVLFTSGVVSYSVVHLEGFLLFAFAGHRLVAAFLPVEIPGQFATSAAACPVAVRTARAFLRVTVVWLAFAAVRTASALQGVVVLGLSGRQPAFVIPQVYPCAPL